MNKLAGNLFWVFMGIVLLVELLTWGVVVRGKASANTKRIEELVGQDGKSGQMRELSRLEEKAQPRQVIDKALEDKERIEKEYAKMVLFLIGKDDRLDRFGPESRISPSKVLRITDKDRTGLGRFLRASIEECDAEVRASGMIPEGKTVPSWNLQDISGAPGYTIWIYAYKQLWILRGLVDVMTQPPGGREAAEKTPEPEPADEDADIAKDTPEDTDAEADADANEDKPTPLVAVLNDLEFEFPGKAKGDIDDRFMFYRFTLNVSMPAANVPVLIERILKHELPLSIESFAIKERPESEGGMVSIGGRPVRVVDAEITCAVIDFSVGVIKVVFSNEHQQFESYVGVEDWLAEKARDDEIAKIILNQIKKTGVDKSKSGDGLEYRLYGPDDWLTTEASECKIYDGVTLHYGSILKNLPNKKQDG